MLFSLALIIFVGFALGGLFHRIKLPSLLGMMLTGILLGPYILNIISPDLLHLSNDLREIALIVILIRAGLSLHIQDLKKIGRPALLMCFIPATIEIGLILFLAPLFFNITLLEAALLGSVLAAVSPAVIVPRMIYLIESGYGQEKRIPQLILASASVDDIYVIILFTAFLEIYQGDSFQGTQLLQAPIAIILGFIIGVLVGVFLVFIFKRFHIRDTIKVLLILSTSFLLVTFSYYVQPWVSISGFLGTMALGLVLREKHPPLAQRLIHKFSKIWVGAELILFVLVGATVDLGYLSHIGLASIALIILALLGRICAVHICLIGTPLSLKERIFTSIAYTPKATVQAAIGAIPLANNVPSGHLILAIAVLSIILTAPLGAIGIDYLSPRLLTSPTKEKIR